MNGPNHVLVWIMEETKSISKTMKSFVKSAIFTLVATCIIMAICDVFYAMNTTANKSFDEGIVELDSCELIRATSDASYFTYHGDTIAISTKNQVCRPFVYCSHGHTHAHTIVRIANYRTAHTITTLVSGTLESYTWHEITGWETFYAGDVLIIMLFCGMVFIFWSFKSFSWCFDTDDNSWNRSDFIHIFTTVLVLMSFTLIVLFYNCGVRETALYL